jgi:DNA polymerase III alpha subunit
VNEQTQEVKDFNLLVDTEEEQIKSIPSQNQVHAAIRPQQYILPARFLNLDLRQHVLEKYNEHLNGASPKEIELHRIDAELEEISNRNIENLFKTIIFVVESFRRQGIVFGVGRGSSCACFILFLIGLNLVNPMVYNIPLDEFFH